MPNGILEMGIQLDNEKMETKDDSPRRKYNKQTIPNAFYAPFMRLLCRYTRMMPQSFICSSKPPNR